MHLKFTTHQVVLIQTLNRLFNYVVRFYLQSRLMSDNSDGLFLSAADN